MLKNAQACWCPLVRLELWNGARGKHEKMVLGEMEKEIPNLKISDDVWAEAIDLSKRARTCGKTIPSTDILIAACAAHYSVGIEHADAHFDTIEDIL